MRSASVHRDFCIVMEQTFYSLCGKRFPPSAGEVYCHSALENNEHSVCHLPHTPAPRALMENSGMMDREGEKGRGERVEAERLIWGQD